MEFNKNLIRALDVDANKVSIDKQVELSVNEYNKKRIRKELKNLRLVKKQENPDAILTSEEISELKNRIFTDIETERYREQQTNLLKSQRTNYHIIRQTLNDLNELNEFSAEIERNNLQTVDGFLMFQSLIDKCISMEYTFNEILKIRKSNIQKYLDSYKNKVLKNYKTEEQLIEDLRFLYSIDNKYDDIELFDNFGLDNNIDVSNKLGDIYITNQNASNHINTLANKNNIFRDLISKNIIDNKRLGLFLLSSFGNDRTSFISNNSITCLKNMYITTENNTYTYNTRTIGELLYEIVNPKNKDIDKQYKQQIYLTYDGTRPFTDEYYKWNGLQVFDIDLKGWNGDINKLKKKMFDYLTDFHWFLWICKSSSGNGIHIYTKVTPPHHVHTNPPDNEYISKYWYMVNYAHKSSIVYDILYRLHKDETSGIKFNETVMLEDTGVFAECEYLDNVVGRITSGIRLTYDEKPLLNPNFYDLHVGLGLSQTLDGYNNQETIRRVLFRNTKNHTKLLNIINNDLVVEKFEDFKNRETEEIDLTKYITLGLDIDAIQPIPKSNINYVTRYNVCNTLASLFGKDGLDLAHIILNSKACKNINEINGFYSCALSNRKEPSKMGLDILKRHGVIKQVKQEIKTQTENRFKDGIKKAIENVLDNKILTYDIDLGEGGFLSQYTHKFVGMLQPDKINMVFSPPNSGKTFWLLQLAKQGKRIMLVLPFISVIKNKVERDPELVKIFDSYYDDKDINELEYGRNAVITFDKFSKINYEKIANMFDYVFIDESHLLFTSAYRIHATSNAVKKIKNLLYISANSSMDPDAGSAKIVLLTGTPTGEEYFFSDIGNIINVKKYIPDKKLTFLICDDILDCLTRLAANAVKLINEGYKLLIPTNKGDIFSEKVMGMIKYLLGRDVKYGYYKRSNTEQEICQLINNHNTVGGYEIVFCTNYLSVGVDINDPDKFASLYLGDWSGYEIEQFNARVRKTGIRTFVCIQTQKSNGDINDLLLDEPNLILKLTQEDIDNFADDKEIAKAKQEFIAEYDPALRAITTPGFTHYQGKFQFDLEQYELTTFENKYTETMQHPVKIAKELVRFDYTIDVSLVYEGLSLAEQEELKKIGIESAKEEKVRKHTLLVGTYLDLVSQNKFVGISSTNMNALEEIRDKKVPIIEEREMDKFVDIEFDSIYGYVLGVKVKSREAFDNMFNNTIYIVSKYTEDRAKRLIEGFVDENGILKQKQFKRSMNLMKLIDNNDRNLLSAPLTTVLNSIYEFVDKFDVSSTYRISYQTYNSILDTWTNQYIADLDIKINTQYGYEKIKDSIIEMLNDVAVKSPSKAGIRFAYNKIPDANSSNIVNKRTVDMMVERMFKITSEVIIENRKQKLRTNHIILEKQEF